MKAYISISFSKRKILEEELMAIKEVLHQLNIEDFVFVEYYSFHQSEEKLMMQQAMADIDSSDFLIAEVSDKVIGVGIEIGYAKAKNKPVVYIRHVNSEHSTTVSGISDYNIFYEDAGNLKTKLIPVIKKIIESTGS